MKRLLTTALAMASLLTTPNAVRAEYDGFGGNSGGDCCGETTAGMYIGAFGGANLNHDLFFTDTGNAGDIYQFESDTGYVIGGYIGYRCCNGIRVEFELAYRDNDIDQVFVFDGGAPVAATLADTNVTAFSYMANIIYECIYCACDYYVRPYFGVGFGGVTVDASINMSSPLTYNVDSDDSVFAWQVLMGVAYPWNDCAEFALEYRFFSADEFELTRGSETVTSRDWLKSHSISASVKYMFGSLW